MGMLCLVGAITLSQLLDEFRVFVSPFSLRPLFSVLFFVGVIFPLVAILARPKMLFLSAVLFLFVLLSAIPQDKWGGGTSSNYFRDTSYGWPVQYLAVHYNKSGDWSSDGKTWIPFEERHLTVAGWNFVIVLAISIVGAFILTVPRRLVEMRLTLSNCNMKGRI